MRTKTLNQIAQEAAKYAVETLDIERALVVKQARDEERASAVMCTGIGDDVVNICRESALLIAAELVRLDSYLIANIESKLYAYLENLPSHSCLYVNRLDAELAEDQRIIKKTKVCFFEPLEKEISVEDMQKIVDANEKLVKELKDAKD